MIEDKNLTYLGTFDGIDFYRYRTRLFRYFYCPMAYYEKLFSRMVRETIDFVRGGYHVIYIAQNDRLVGYGIVTKGGGRNRFCTADDIVLNSLWVMPKARGNGFANLLYRVLTSELGVSYDKAYAYIRPDNQASIKAALRSGFVKVANASRKGILRSVVIDPNGRLGIYEKVHPGTAHR